MNIYIPQHDEGRIGGGWTFMRNFRRGMDALGVHWARSIDEADVCFIPSITQAEKGEVYECEKRGIPIFLRVDNIPRRSRNRRSSPHQRLQEYGKFAEVVIYQSEWAKEYAGYLAGEGTVIFNGCDTEIFRPDGPKHEDRQRKHVSLIVYHNNDEVKRIVEAFYHHHMDWRQDPDRELWIVGRFPQEVVDNDFDLFCDEPYQYFGVVDDPMEMAKIMRGADELIYPAMLDAGPNTVVEALACGLEVTHLAEMGGARELVDYYEGAELEQFSLERMCGEYKGLMEMSLNMRANGQ